ncbi:hypothetical protein HanPI659440_Chr11g0407561 [Helianthus annuus]|nr:hypothetical protein HanPI659440_Chr11g0407561 [Helianthus annuus]
MIVFMCFPAFVFFFIQKVWFLIDFSCSFAISYCSTITWKSRFSQTSKWQDAASRGIAGVDFDVVHYGLASTPAMFNSTLTKNEDILCPVDGAILITGKITGTEYYTILKEHCYALTF